MTQLRTITIAKTPRTRDNQWFGLRTQLRPPFIAALAVLALSAPTALRGQTLDYEASRQMNGAAVAAERAGIGTLSFSPASTALAGSIAGRSFGVSSGGGFVSRREAAHPILMDGVGLVQRDTSGQHRSSAHHAVVGAAIGAAAGAVLGVAGDRVWFGSGDFHGHFQNLWLLTTPVGALVGSLVATL